MTGLGSSSSYTYAAGTDYYSDPVVEYFNSGGAVQASPYMTNLPGLGTFFDIAYEGGDGTGDIWFACGDGGDSPIKAYDTAGNLVNYIPGTDVPGAHGLCFDTAGYLWAANGTNDTIYKIDLSTGVSGSGEIEFDTRALQASSNPFIASVTIQGSGFEGQARLEIFDLSGRRVLAVDGFDGAFHWDGRAESGSEVPAGPYVVRVTDTAAEPVTLKLIRI